MKYLLLPALFLVSCSFLHMAPLQIEAWTPASSYIHNIEELSISLTFSNPVDFIKAEQAIKVLENGIFLKGKIQWEDDTLALFVPYEPLRANRLYTIEVSTLCEDIYGNSLVSPFSHEFSTSSDTERPTVNGVTPADGEHIDILNTPVSIEFSEPMDWGSLLENFSISPAVSGSCTMSSDQQAFTFTPYELYSWQEEYTITLSDGAADYSGNTLGEDFISRFFTGDDTEIPCITGVSNGNGFLLLPDSQDGHTVNSGWETDWNITVEFSEPVNPEGLSAKIDFDPPMPFSLERLESVPSPVLEIGMDAPFVHGNLYQLRILDGYEDAQGNEGSGSVYFFLVDGPATKPPEATRLTFLLDSMDNPGSVTNLYWPDGANGYENSLAIDVSAYDSGPPAYETGFFDLYLTLADWDNQNWDLLRINLIDAFSINPGNRCAEILPLALELFPSTSDPPPGTNECVARFHAGIFDTVESGIIEFILNGDFTDGSDNPIAETWTLRLNK